MTAQETLAAALAAKLTEELGWDWKGEQFEDVCMRGGSMDVPSGKQVIDELAESLASEVAALPTIAIVPVRNRKSDDVAVQYFDGVNYKINDQGVLLKRFVVDGVSGYAIASPSRVEAHAIELLAAARTAGARA
ncbi:hypothetical protein CH273_25645 [Rhodococcus sp. 05-339-2]|uniref:hypothetical protein n=1 Tax=Rhodococcoides fascians TaxID=1828 RepID=UPI00050C8648|nr:MULTISPECIES: hypothetical protein [Rhodococcus]OZD74877.1 hypothetical protein CH273_25645 [Rhodococcus sp. 05-339-2]